jgi:hypothetical protein
VIDPDASVRPVGHRSSGVARCGMDDVLAPDGLLLCLMLVSQDADLDVVARPTDLLKQSGSLRHRECD